MEPYTQPYAITLSLSPKATRMLWHPCIGKQSYVFYPAETVMGTAAPSRKQKKTTQAALAEMIILEFDPRHPHLKILSNYFFICMDYH